MNDKTLPDKLSDCIELALRDEQACFDSPTYRINMDTYHTPLDDGTCEVCFAGACMAQTLGTPPNYRQCVSDFCAHNKDRLIALDCVRQGCIVDALRELDELLNFDEIADWVVHEYESSADRNPFRADMQRIADWLRDCGF